MSQNIGCARENDRPVDSGATSAYLNLLRTYIHILLADIADLASRSIQFPRYFYRSVLDLKGKCICIRTYFIYNKKYGLPNI